MKEPRLTALVSTLLVAFAVSSQAFALSPDGNELLGQLNARTNGGDSRYANSVAPAQYLTNGAAANVRVAQANSVIATEADNLAQAFTTAPEGARRQAVLKVLAASDPETARDGAARLFYGGGPAMSIFRQIFFVPAASLGSNAVARVTDAVSSFELLPKPDDYYYVYSNGTSSAQSNAPEKRGASNSYQGPAPAMQIGQPYMVKKCRSIVFSWYCNTSQYEAKRLTPHGGEASQTLITSLFDLTRNNDAADFNRDGRTQNTVDGYTAAYYITRAGSEVMVYSIGIQHTSQAPRFQGQLNSGMKLEYRQLVERVNAVLGVKAGL